jgi:cation:H+ antiporter
VGNLVGSNIINVTLILGVAGLVAPVVVRSGVPRREAPLAVAGVVLLAACALLGLDRIAGTVLAGAGAAALIMLVRLSRPPAGDPMPEEVDTFLDQPARRSRLGVETARSVLGLLGTLGGAQLLVVNAAAGADRLGVPSTIVGFTVVALGTSLPELVTAVQAQRHGQGDLLVGNLLGSNLFNSVAGGAIVGLVTWDTPVRVAYPAVAAMVVTSLAAWWVLYRKLRVSRPEAVLLLLVYLLTLPLIG